MPVASPNNPPMLFVNRAMVSGAEINHIVEVSEPFIAGPIFYVMEMKALTDLATGKTATLIAFPRRAALRGVR